MSCFSFRTSVLICLCVTAACRPTATSTAPQPTPNPEPPVHATPTTTSGAWTITPVVALRQYRITTETSLELANIRDSTTSDVNLSLAAHDLDSTIEFSGTIDSVTLSHQRQTRTVIRSGNTIAFSGRLNSNTVSFQPAPTCDTAGFSGASLISRLLDVIPQHLHSGMSWTDSVSTIACSGSIPVVIKTTRNYRVIEESGSSPQAILISRADTSITLGEGTEDQHRVRISSNGSGTTNLLIDLHTGALLQSTNQYRGLVTVSASGRTQVFSQVIHETIQGIP